MHADAYMWSERRRGGAKDHSAAIAALEAEAPPVRGGARVAYDAFHPEPWGWKVALYLWTKNIGAGVWALAFLAPALGLVALSRELRLAAAFASLAFIGLTTLLLVWDPATSTCVAQTVGSCVAPMVWNAATSTCVES